MKTSLRVALALAAYSITAVAAAPSNQDCSSIRSSIQSAVQKDQTKVLEIVSNFVSKNPECSCEIVKTAITTTDADRQLVAKIVESAIYAAPDQIRPISQCAIAVAPDAIKEVNAVIAKFDKNAGESASAKSKTSPKDAIAGANDSKPKSSPLDFPAGPNGTPGQNPVDLPPFFIPPLIPPAIGITPPDVTSNTVGSTSAL